MSETRGSRRGSLTTAAPECCHRCHRHRRRGLHSLSRRRRRHRRRGLHHFSRRRHPHHPRHCHPLSPMRPHHPHRRRPHRRYSSRCPKHAVLRSHQPACTCERDSHGANATSRGNPRASRRSRSWSRAQQGVAVTSCRPDTAAPARVAAELEARRGSLLRHLNLTAGRLPGETNTTRRPDTAAPVRVATGLEA